MRTFTACIVMALAITATAHAQVKKTEETRTETQTSTDSTGKTVTTSSITSVSQSEDITPRANMISCDPFKLVAFFNLGYYHTITPTVAIGGEVALPTALMENDMSGVLVSLEARIYLGKKPFRGFHLNPFVTAGTLTYNDPLAEFGAPQPQQVTDTPISLGMMMGWHWYPWEDFATQIALGAQYNASPTTGDGVTGLASDKKGIVPAGRFTIGYSW